MAFQRGKKDLSPSFFDAPFFFFFQIRKKGQGMAGGFETRPYKFGEGGAEGNPPALRPAIQRKDEFARYSVKNPGCPDRRPALIFFATVRVLCQRRTIVRK
jgi:hypothetical protein